jgi:multidrug resistance protein
MAKLVVLFVVAFVDMIGAVMILPLLPFYATDLGASATMVGLLISAFSLAQLLFAPTWGRLSDRLGRRPAILIGLGITAVSYLVFAFATSVVLLFVSRFVQGIGGGTIGVVQAYVADASPPSERTKSLGWLTAVTSLGAVAGPALGSLLIALGGRTAPGLAAAALAALTAAFAWRFLRESKGMRVSQSKGALPAHPMATTSTGALVHVLTRWHEPAPRLIWIYAVAIGGFYGTGGIVPLLLHERFHVTAKGVGYIFMYLGAMGVVVRAGLLGRLVDRFGEARLARAGIVLLAAGLWFSAAAHAWPVLFVGLTLMPLGTAFLFPSIGGILSRVVPSGQRGLYFGVQQTFGGVSRVAFPIGAGFLMDNVGTATPFWVAGALVLASLPLASTLHASSMADA